MLSNTIKISERVKRPRKTSCGIAAHEASRYMKRKIQIESGPMTEDRGSRRSHLDEPCPIHENPKHTARQCRVLKKLCRPLTTSYRRRQLNRESSPDHLTFQIARTTISSNYPGEEFKTLDREILVVSADVPPQDGETDEQCQEHENANAARAVRRQQQIVVAPQVRASNQVNNRSTPGRSTTMPGNKHLRHRLPLRNDATMTHLVPTEYAQETSSGISSAMALKFTTLHKTT
jgi:hypothetical protein